MSEDSGPFCEHFSDPTDCEVCREGEIVEEVQGYLREKANGSPWELAPADAERLLAGLWSAYRAALEDAQSLALASAGSAHTARDRILQLAAKVGL